MTSCCMNFAIIIQWIYFTIWKREKKNCHHYNTILSHTYLHSKCLELYWFSSWLGNFWPLGGHKHSERGSQQSSPPPESFLSFFSTCFKIWTWNLVYTSGRWLDTSSLSFITIRSLPLKSSQDFFSKCFEVSIWKLVYTLSRLHNIFSSCFTRMGYLWPSSCS